MHDYPDWLSYSQENGLRDLDVAFGRFLFDINKKNDAALLLSALTSYQLSNGNPCLSLDNLCTNPTDFIPPKWLDYLSDNNNLFNVLKSDKSVIAALLKQSDYISTDTTIKPLSLVGDNLYLQRYWQAANNIIASINNLLNKNYINTDNFSLYKDLLSLAFDSQTNTSDDTANWQKIACAIALHNQFAIITGGPGTGKTTTVVKLLCILQAVALNSGLANGLRISLAAPTGKAAARLNESINTAFGSLGFNDELLIKALQLIPTQASTLHSLLGVRFNSRFFIHNENNPLDLDVLVVDEASMMDIEMFDAVFRALPKHARLIILGDKDQLSSVEAGAIMGELCARSAKAYYSNKFAQFIADLTQQTIPELLVNDNGNRLDQAVAMLRKSYRFHEHSGIGKLASAINSSDIGAIKQMIKQPSEDLEFIKPVLGRDNWAEILFKKNSYPALFNFIKNNQPAIGASTRQWDDYAHEVLKLQTKFQVLCALRHGPWGTKAINYLVEHKLKLDYHIEKTSNEWYLGRPIMVLRNRPDLGLANGDIGVALHVPDGLNKGKKIIRVAFINSSNGNILWLSPSRLDQVDTVYALTVHKSQGSEFEHVVLVLPDVFSPVMTKELLYTGVTRAKKRLSMVIPNGIKTLEAAIKNPTKRSKALITERIG